VLRRRVRWRGGNDKSLLMVCKIMGEDSDGTSEYEEWF
jgi:hypothetical protein